MSLCDLERHNVWLLSTERKNWSGSHKMTRQDSKNQSSVFFSWICKLGPAFICCRISPCLPTEIITFSRILVLISDVEFRKPVWNFPNSKQHRRKSVRCVLCKWTSQNWFIPGALCVHYHRTRRGEKTTVPPSLKLKIIKYTQGSHTREENISRYL